MMVKDPVCGMQVSEEAAREKAVYREQTYHFCSTLCKQMFEREPQKYIIPLDGTGRTRATAISQIAYLELRLLTVAP